MSRRNRRNGGAPQQVSAVWDALTRTTNQSISTFTYFPVGKPLSIKVWNPNGPSTVVSVVLEFWNNDAGAVVTVHRMYNCPSGANIDVTWTTPFCSSAALPTAVGDTAVKVLGSADVSASFLYAN